MLREFPLPVPLAGSAGRWLEGAAEVAPPRRAATVVLVRDTDAGIEVFLLRRHLTMAFAGGMHVFPGGGVDPRDSGDDVPWAGPDVDTWGRELGTHPEAARGFVSAAVRETFEECGVLLAGPGPAAPLCEPVGDDWEDERRRLVSRERALSQVLRDRGLVLRSDLLRPWAHWTTPEFEPRRYDTRFLLARLPVEQDARHVEEGEATESGWWRPVDVLDRYVRGEVLLLPPTLVTLEELAAAPDTATLWAAPRVLREVLPWLDRRDGRPVLVVDLPVAP